MGAALAGADEAGNCDDAVDLFASRPKVELVGFVSATAPGEAPLVGVALGSELVGLLGGPKLNFGVDIVLGVGIAFEAF